MDSEIPFDRVAVLGAFRVEIEIIADFLSRASGLREAGPLTYVEGKLGDRHLLVGSTGVGKVRAAAGVQAAADLFRPALVIICGTAGALSKKIRPLDLVVAEKLLQHDTGPKDPEWTMLEPNVADRLEEASRITLDGTGQSIHRGGLVTGDQPVLSKREGTVLAKRFGALAVDMEAAAALVVCRANGLPMGVIKAITDSADRKGIGDFKKNVKEGAARAQQAVTRFLDA